MNEKNVGQCHGGWVIYAGNKNLSQLKYFANIDNVVCVSLYELCAANQLFTNKIKTIVEFNTTMAIYNKLKFIFQSENIL